MKPERVITELLPPMTSSYNPATGEKIGEFPLHSKADLAQMIAQARTAQADWSRWSVKKRVQKIRKIRDYLVKNHDLLADIISQDNGKSRFDALVTEILAGAMALDYYCQHAARFLADNHLKRSNIFIFNKRSQIVRIPYGVIGIISPWNYPFVIPFSEVIMGLLAGNAVILKVASETQWVGQQLKTCIEAAELPAGVFNFLNMPGRIVGDALLAAGINKLFFTGSVAVGKELMGKAAATLTPLTLELGGNDPMLVCADADLSRAAAGAVWAGFQNCGQSCGGVERIYVEQSVYEPFLKLLKKAVENLRVGPDQNFEVDLGAMTTQRQMETVQRHIADALQKGAQIYAQAPAPTDSPGQFLPAVVLTQVNHEMLVMREETFGPVVAVMPVANMEEALCYANDSNLGLTASIWSRQRHTAVKLARRIQAGVVMINDHLMSHGMAETPWGGFKESGLGRTHGRLGFDEMTQSQVIVDDWFTLARRNLWWYPADKRSYAGIKGVLQLLYGQKIKDRLTGLAALLKILPRMFQRSV